MRASSSPIAFPAESGNLYNGTAGGGHLITPGGGGTTYKLSLSDGRWTITGLHDFLNGGSPASLVMDKTRNLCGMTKLGGSHRYGSMFKLVHTGNGFWQVETSSLRDFPQQFRTFEIYLNSDYSISIAVINVDPAVAEGTPAAKSRSYAIAEQQIIQNDKLPNSSNTLIMSLPDGIVSVDTMARTRPQGIPSAATPYKDPTIVCGSVPDVPYCASYSAELFKYLNPQSSTYTALQRICPHNKQGNVAYRYRLQE